MTDQTALFDTIGDIRLDRPHHSCTGLLCTYCERFDRQDVEVLAEIDPAWRMQATIFRKSLAIGGLFSADLLIEAIGKPLGDFVTSTRESNNGRTIRVWRRTA